MPSGAPGARLRRSAGRALGWAERAAVGAAMLCLAAMGLMTAVSIAGRALFRLPVPDDVLLAELMMTAIVALPLSAVQHHGGHITVTLFTERLPRRMRLALGALGNLIGCAFVALMVWGVGETVAEDFAGGHYYYGLLDLPVWPMKAVFLTGIAAFALRLLLDSLAQLLGALSPAERRAPGA